VNLAIRNIDEAEAKASHFRNCLKRSGLMTVSTYENWNKCTNQVSGHFGVRATTYMQRYAVQLSAPCGRFLFEEFNHFPVEVDS
jgi:hypothetical protein